MKLVETEAPIAEDDRDEPHVTPPRPPHRRVSVSLLLTLAILVGTVVGVYVVFPARHHVLSTEAIAQHRDQATPWELTAPTVGEAQAWARGVLGDDAVPLPSTPTLRVIGVRRASVLDRPAAILRVEVGDDHERVTYAIQRVRGVAPNSSERDDDGAIRVVAWRNGKYAVAAVGADATSTQWLALVKP